MVRVLLINLDRLEHVSSVLTDQEIELSVITTKQNSRHYKESRVSIAEDLADTNRVYRAALRLAGLDGFDYVVTPLERALIPAGMIRSNLGIQGMTYDQALGFANKFVMKERIRKAGIPVARYSLVPHVSAAPEAGIKVGWPIILKPAVGSGAHYTYRLFSEKHARTQIRQDRDLQMLARREVPMIAEHQLDDQGVACRGGACAGHDERRDPP